LIISPISAGAVPLKEFPSRISRSKLTRFPTSDGRVPDSLLFSKYKNLREVILKISVGRELLKPLSLRASSSAYRTKLL